MGTARGNAAVLLAGGLALGLWACDETVINVPTVTTLSIDPSDPSVFQGDDLQLNAILADDQGRTLKDRTIEWSVDDQGVATVDAAGRLTGMAVGETTVRASSEGASASAPVVVPNRPPSVTLLQPDGAAPVVAGGPVQFRSSATDPEDGDLSGTAVQWTSSVDGQIGTDTAFVALVSTGDHRIRVTATDSHGESATDSVDVLVHEAPTVGIIEPVQGSVFAQGEAVVLRGTATDPEDGPLSGAAVVWASSLDGALGTDTVLTTTSLSIGQHTIRLEASDSHGATGIDSVQIQVEQNDPPTAFISEPANLSVFTVGASVTFRGTANDAQDGALSGAAVVWTSSIDGQIGTDTVFTTSALSAGQHMVRMEVTDSHSATDRDSISIVINQPPTAAVTAPGDGSSFPEGDPIEFHATADDPEDGPLSGPAVTWTSSLDGQIGTDTTFTTSGLSPGEHTVVLEARDSYGASGFDTVLVTVAQNQAPTATIIDPPDSSAFNEGDPVTFRGAGSDPEDGTLSGPALTWSSSIDGQIGTDTVFTTTGLSPGQHVIRLTATDALGATGNDSILVIVNGAPVAAISAPPDSSTYTEGAVVGFRGSATDLEDGALAGGALVWTSSLDGQIGTDTAFTTASLSVGEHRIRLTATDSDGATGSDSVVVTVNAAPTVAILGPANLSTFVQDEPVTFRAAASDPEDGPLSGPAVVWFSDPDGQIGTDSVFTTGSLSPGQHTIVVAATDSDGATARDSILLTVKTFEEAIAGSWATWWDATGEVTMTEGSAGAWLSAAAFQHSSSAANFGMEQYSRIPRIATINDTADTHYGFLAFPYEALTQAAWEASRGLRALLVDGVNLGAGDQERALAFGKFVLGISHGYLAMLYDAGPAIDESVPNGTDPGFYAYPELAQAALSYLDEAIVYANNAAFTIPENWMWVSGGVSNARLARIAHSFKARIMAAVARTPAERAAADWAAIVNEASQGITTDLNYTFDSLNDRMNLTLYYQIAPAPWSSLNYFVLAMADTSGNYLNWMSTPVVDRQPDLGPGDPFLIHTPDERFPKGATLTEQLASPGTRFQARDGTDLAWIEPDRGTWRWSYYGDARDAAATTTSGSSPDLTTSEMTLLRAEYALRIGDNTGAAALINQTRTAAGLPATDNLGTNSVCVPRLPDGTCGGLWEMLKYEKRLVASHNNGHMSAGWYFDSRGWGDLMEGTIINLPLPAHIAIENGFPVENYGGVGGTWAAGVGTYGY